MYEVGRFGLLQLQKIPIRNDWNQYIDVKRMQRIELTYFYVVMSI